ncbi:hypothetical protein EYF80_005691 [Liparis tanakae]|uniref:Uncharacterized protein n=1 Tax=Liparis tanakae TaxID=230148 RepID=A0A4Z2J1A5_9TELE|nr:hypothetical protein EYF80_005691 [Liparis tanakae]
MDVRLGDLRILSSSLTPREGSGPGSHSRVNNPGPAFAPARCPLTTSLYWPDPAQAWRGPLWAKTKHGAERALSRGGAERGEQLRGRDARRIPNDRRCRGSTLRSRVTGEEVSQGEAHSCGCEVLRPQLALNPLENDPDHFSNLLCLQPQYEGQMWDMSQSAPRGVALEEAKEQSVGKGWLHCICMSGPHPHPHHYQQQKQPYSQFAIASGLLTRDPGQLAGPLPNRFLSTAAGFDSP